MKYCKSNNLCSDGNCLSDGTECMYEKCNQWQPFTQYDRINCMSVDELTLFLFEWGDHNITICNTLCGGYKSRCARDCVAKLKQWLESEVDTE